jgi:hypothetical protein
MPCLIQLRARSTHNPLKEKRRPMDTGTGALRRYDD